MDLDDYQAEAKKTETLPVTLSADDRLHFFIHGLVDEVGQLASLQKKCMRNDIDLSAQKPEFVSRLGDVLWYVASLASQLDIRLSDVAQGNLAFLQGRWGSHGDGLFSPRREFLSEEGERFPDSLEFNFEREQVGPLTMMRLTLPDGTQVGDMVDDNEYEEDFYRFHDVVHIGLLACFRWSPVFRKLLKLKRKSDLDTDRVEDGAKALDTEEAMNRLIWLYFEQNNFLEGATNVDTWFLKLLRLFSREREIGWVSGKQWQDFMLLTAAVIREMIAASKQGKGGRLLADLNGGTLTFKPAA
jgi:NTP pyrophosphatase (non-canonical NTP hydrolase)